MKEVNVKFQYKEKEYALVFNLNVMQAIQEEYGSLAKWGELTSGSEPNAKAVIFGFTQMLNEGIDIENEEKGTSIPFFTLKQSGRLITEVGMDTASSVLKETVVNSTKGQEKNA